MDIATIIGTLQESLFMILVFLGFLGFAMIRGRQSIINLILSLYLALLISLKFPYYEYFVGGNDHTANAVIKIIIFALFTTLAAFIFGRLMPVEYDETAFEGFGKKLLFAVLCTILVMAYSYHALPVTELITPGTPIQALFAPESNFFWWMMLPLISLLFL